MKRIDSTILDKIKSAASEVWMDGRMGLPAVDRNGNPKLKFLLVKNLTEEQTKEIFNHVDEQLEKIKSESKKLNKHQIYEKYDFKWLNVEDQNLKNKLAENNPFDNLTYIKTPEFYFTNNTSRKCSEFTKNARVVQFTNHPKYNHCTAVVYDDDKKVFQYQKLYGFSGLEGEFHNGKFPRAKCKNFFIKQIVDEFKNKMNDENYKFCGVNDGRIIFEAI